MLSSNTDLALQAEKAAHTVVSGDTRSFYLKTFLLRPVAFLLAQLRGQIELAFDSHDVQPA